MWQFIDEAAYKLQKYRPSSEKELEEAPGLKFRKILPIVSVRLRHENSDRVFKAVATIRRIKEKVGSITRVVAEKWVYTLQKPEQTSARCTEDVAVSDQEVFRKRLAERFGDDAAAAILLRLQSGIEEAEADRPLVEKPVEIVPQKSSPAPTLTQADIIARILGRK